MNQSSNFVQENKTELDCPICGSKKYKTFFEATDVPVQDGVLWNSQEEALNSPVGDISLAFCYECGYIGNQLFEPEKIRYDSEYSFTLHYSSTYKRFIDELAMRLADKYSLAGKSILEIGCGQGDFLRSLHGLGIGKSIGIDPSLVYNIVQEDCSGGIEYVKDIYTEKYRDIRCDMVICRHLLNQLHNPKDFVEMLYDNLCDKPETVVYFETPNGTPTFEHVKIWNIVYERCSWFTTASISNLFSHCGFKVVLAEPCFEDQYLGIEARSGSNFSEVTGRRSEELRSSVQFIEKFTSTYPDIVREWEERLETLQENSKRVIAWGAGAPAISFLNTFEITENIPYVVDINPLRQGQFLPRTGQLVVPPEFIIEYQPDIILITNQTYKKEIMEQVGDLGAKCDFLLL